MKINITCNDFCLGDDNSNRPSLHAKKTSLLGTKDQAGHSEVEMTMMYYHTDPVNAEYRALPNDLMD